MLALINIRPAGELVGVEFLSDLPNPPALRWSAFLIRVSGELTLDGLVAWALEMRDARPMVPIGIADSFRADERKLIDGLARVGLRFNLVLHLPSLASEDLVGAVEALRDASVEREILQGWMLRGNAQALEPLLVQIIAHGVRGGRGRVRAGRQGLEPWSVRGMRCLPQDSFPRIQYGIDMATSTKAIGTPTVWMSGAVQRPPPSLEELRRLAVEAKGR